MIPWSTSGGLLAVALVACGGGGSTGSDTATGTTPTTPTTTATTPTPGQTVPEGIHSVYRPSFCVVTDAPYEQVWYQPHPPVSGTVIGQDPVDHEGLVNQGWNGGCQDGLSFLSVLADDGTTWHFGWGSETEALPWDDLPVSPGESVSVTAESWSGMAGGAYGLYVEAGGELRFAMRVSGGLTGVPSIDAMSPTAGTYQGLYQLGDCGGPLIFERWSLALSADAPLEIDADEVGQGALDGRPLQVLNTGVWTVSELSGYCGDMESGRVSYILRVEAAP